MSLSTLIICDDSETAKQIRQLISAAPAFRFIKTVESAAAASEIESVKPQLAWIELGSRPVRGLALLAELHRTFPGLMLMTSFSALDAELVRTAFRLGAVDFIDHGTWEKDLNSCADRIAANIKSGHSGPGALKEKSAPFNTLLICDADAQKQDSIKKLVATQKSLNFLGTTSLAKALEEVKRKQPGLIWLELSPNQERALQLLGDLKQSFPTTPVIVSNPLADAELIRKSYRAGAMDFLDAARWRKDLPAAIAQGKEKTKSKTLISRLLWIAAVATVSYLIAHFAHR